MIQTYRPHHSSSFPKKPVRLGKVIEKWILYLVVLGIAGISIYWFVAGKGKYFEVNLISQKGTVEYRENEKDAWKKAENLPLKINPPLEIRTLADSDASFLIGDGSKVKLGSFSRIVLSKNQGEINWIQTDGNSHHQVAKSAERKSYKVSTSDGDFESVGTAFEVKMNDTDTIILVLKDQLHASYKDKSTVEAKEGEKIVITPVGKKVKEIEEQDLKENWTLNNLTEDQKNNLPIGESVLEKAGLKKINPEENNPESNAQVSTDTSSGGENNNSEDQAEAEKPSANTNQENADQQTKISLKAKQSSNGILLDWANDGSGNWDSWKVLKGLTEELIYPNDSYRTVPREAKSYLWEINGDGGVYYFRVCAWTADKGCISYSNSENLTVNATGNAVTNNLNNNSTDINGNISPDSNNPANQNTNSNTESPNKIGTTTRKKCEGSGGHWSESNNTCKCPPNKLFAAGKCKKQ